jgi:hypothetical protein
MQEYYTYDEAIVSDLYKEAYGYRPTGKFFQEWDNSSQAQKQLLWEDLLEASDAAMDADKDLYAASAKEYEARIKGNLKLGAENRDVAISWILDAEDLYAEEDAGYICYLMHLPYEYEEEFKKILMES